MQDFINLISQLGFPIAVSVALFWLVVKTLNSFEQTIKNNTAVMQEFLKKVGDKENG